MDEYLTDIQIEIIQQAIEWRVRLESRSDELDFHACQHWRQLDNRHEQAWQKVTDMEALFNSLTPHSTELVKVTLQKSESELKKTVNNSHLVYGF